MDNKNYSYKLSILILFFIFLILTGCFSHWQGDSAKVVISLGRADRAVYNPNDSATHQRLEHKIKFSNEVKTLEFTFNGSGAFEAYLEPGDWNVEIVSWLDGDVYAKGEKDVSLKLGLNNETINMFQAHLVKFVPGGGNAIQEQVIYHAMKIENPPDAPTEDGWYDDSFTEPLDLNEVRIFESITFYAKWIDPKFPDDGTLQEKLIWINSYAIDGGYYVITVDEYENLPPTSLSYSGKTVTITLTSDNETQKTIQLSESGTLFYVGSGVNLKLDGYITLRGLQNNNASLIKIENGGILEMKTMSKITVNITDGWQAGVFLLGKNAKFTMNGGEISNITAKGGGAVWAAGTFIMNGGKIFNNKSKENSGGGVWALGTFNMTGGEISGNFADVYDGGGVHVYNGGTFTMSGGTISGNTAQSGGGGVSVWVSGTDGNNKTANSTFTMSGGTISGNTAIGGGGGVKVGKNDTTFNSIFTMIGGKISGNTGEYGGGVHIGGDSTFTMNGGEISGNTAKGSAGVLTDGTFTMNGGEISGNIATDWNCGGVCVGSAGRFEMNNGKIYGNTAKGEGGGVLVSGIFTMSGGEISGNTAIDNNGGGVEVSGEKAKFSMNGGKISGNNTLKGVGGGVGVDNRGTFTMSGGEISGNNAFNREGGGVCIGCGLDNTATFIMEGGVISNNTANSGGGVRVWNGKFEKLGKKDGGKIEGNNGVFGEQVSANRDNGNERKRDAPVFPEDPMYYYGKDNNVIGFD
jgi:hypothetical protein